MTLFPFFRVPRHIAPALLLLPLCAAPQAAHAQFRPDTLNDALKASTTAPYNTARFGPLIIVAPSMARLAPDAPRVREDGIPADSINTLAPLYRRRIAHFGAVTTLVPEQMVVLLALPMSPQEWASRPDRAVAARRFAASLTSAQWNKAGSAEGIGRSDLTSREQRDLFSALLPHPFRLKTVTAAEGGGYISGVNGQDVTGAPFELSAAQLSTVRLRIVRSMSWMYGFKDGNTSRIGYGTARGSYTQTPGSQFTILDSPNDYSERQDALTSAIRRVEPNHLKPSDLSFDDEPMKRPLLVAGAERVGDLIQRAAEVTGIEIYADRRVASLPVVVVAGEQQKAAAGDVLRAICLSVSGAVRKVSDSTTGDFAYLLTEDHQAGLATRRMRWNEWYEDVEALNNAEQAKAETAIRGSDAASHIGFDPKDPYALSAATMRAAETDITRPRQPGESYDTSLPVSSLPPAAQDTVKKQLEDRKRSTPPGTPDTIMDDRVYTNFGVSTQLIVPGYGAFDGPFLSSLSSLLPGPATKTPPPAAPAPPIGPVSVPAALKQPAALLGAPTTPAEAETLVSAATAHGFTAVWVEVPVAADKDDIVRADAALAAAAAAGRRANITVGAALRLFRVSAGVEEKKDDRNLFGETSSAYGARRAGAPAVSTYYKNDADTLIGRDWLQPTDPRVRALIVARAKAISAAAPTLSAITLRDAVPPGYGQDDNGYIHRTFAGRYLGYTPAQRLACLRRENVDPIDLLPSDGANPFLPTYPDGPPGYPLFFPNDGERYYYGTQFPSPFRYTRDPKTGAWSREEVKDGHTLNAGWNRLRREASQTALTALRQDLAAALPSTLPVYWGAPGGGDGSSLAASWYTVWPKDLATPPTYADHNKKDAPAASRPWLLSLVVSPQSTPEGIARGVSQLPERAHSAGDNWSGFVLDFCQVPASAVPTLLGRLAGFGPPRPQ